MSLEEKSCFHVGDLQSGNNSEVIFFFLFPASQVVSTLRVSKVETTQEPFKKKISLQSCFHFEDPQSGNNFFPLKTLVNLPMITLTLTLDYKQLFQWQMLFSFNVLWRLIGDILLQFESKYPKWDSRAKKNKLQYWK